MPRLSANHSNMRIYRPGSFQTGSYRTVVSKPVKKSHKLRTFTVAMFLLVMLIGVIFSLKTSGKTLSYHNLTNSLNSFGTSPLTKPVPIPINQCAGNTQAKNIMVILSLQHIWVCSYSQPIYNSAVITGYTGNPADVTPTGVYQVYTKEVNLHLTGNDGVTSWDDPVSYWMPFLFNQYGAYGFHDATWRTPNQFGHIDTSSPNASHGCVESPLATAKFLYSWVLVGTTVTIKAN